MDELKTYEMLINDDLLDGVNAISLVDSPAIMTDYILLSKDQKDKIEIKLEKLIDKKRQIVCGPALIPDIIIPRKGYNITFSKDTIRKISENFLINGKKDNVTLEHQISVNKIKLIESWIVIDPKQDKSTSLGYDLPIGTWMTSFKILDDNLWNEYISSGILKGFSIEGNFTQQEVKLSYKKDTSYSLDTKIVNLVKVMLFSASDLDKFYMWKLGTGGVSHKNCPICIENNKKIKTLREWINYGLPNVPNGTNVAGLSTNYKTAPYATYCEDTCSCELVPINSPSIKKIIRKPF